MKIKFPFYKYAAPLALPAVFPFCLLHSSFCLPYVHMWLTGSLHSL
jgi:hypothetical protein